MPVLSAVTRVNPFQMSRRHKSHGSPGKREPLHPAFELQMHRRLGSRLTITTEQEDCYTASNLPSFFLSCLERDFCREKTLISSWMTACISYESSWGVEFKQRILRWCSPQAGSRQEHHRPHCWLVRGHGHVLHHGGTLASSGLGPRGAHLPRPYHQGVPVVFQVRSICGSMRRVVRVHGHDRGHVLCRASFPGHRRPWPRCSHHRSHRGHLWGHLCNIHHGRL